MQKAVLTEYRDDDDDKVEHVPGLFEEMQPQADKLEKTLAGEDDDERRVDDVQTRLELRRLFVVFQAHQYHVEQNHDHDENVELLVGHHGEDETLYQQLRAVKLTSSSLTEEEEEEIYCA